MNENAEKWVAALRSGDYDQTKSFLRDDKGFCCLGVACDLYRKDTGDGKWKRKWMLLKSKHYYGFSFGSRNAKGEQVSGLPVPVSQWLGVGNALGNYDPLPTGNGKMASLSMRNDSGNSFSEIADIIESEPEGLFHE